MEYIDDPCIGEVNRFVMGVILLAVPSLFLALVLPRRARRLKEFLVGLFLIGIFLAIAWPSTQGQANKAKQPPFESALNVMVEDKFTVGEYDVVILSAKQLWKKTIGVILDLSLLSKSGELIRARN